MLGLAALSYSKIETPIRKSSRLFTRRSAIATGIGVLSFSVVLINYIKQYASAITLATNPVIQSTWWQNKEGKYIEYCLVKKEFSRQTMINCLGPLAPRKQPIAFLLGDSHARNYMIAAKNAFPDHKTKYLTMGFGCAFLPSSMISASVDVRVKCSEYVKEVTRYIQQLAQPGDIIFIGQALLGPNLHIRSKPEYFSHIGSFANHFKDIGVPVVLFDGAYSPGIYPELCTKEVWRPFPSVSNCQKPIHVSKNAYQRFDEKASELARTHQNIFYAPLRTGLCTKKTCGQATASGTQIWHDNGHITEDASGELAGLLRRELRAGGFFEYFRLPTNLGRTKQ
jgi:hypothetical protein